MTYANILEAYAAHKDDVNPDSHLWLYAKHHYVRHDVWEDLKLLIGVRNLLEPECIPKNDVLCVVGNIAIPFLQSGSGYALQDFFTRLSLRAINPFGLGRLQSERQSEMYEDRLLAGFLSVMSHQRVRQGNVVVIPLDKPDPDLLPTVTLCKKGGEHIPVTDGVHLNVCCSKCFQSLE